MSAEYAWQKLRQRYVLTNVTNVTKRPAVMPIGKKHIFILCLIVFAMETSFLDIFIFLYSCHVFSESIWIE